ncbi:MAG: signal peptidase I, partial [Candidatus Paceibacteria bacterium]
MNSRQETPKKSFGQEALELFRFVLIVLAVVVPIRVFIAQPFIVNGESMLPTLENGNYLIIDEISYRTMDPERGEVIVFRNPTNTKQFLIKRIIGLPGETIEISGSSVVIREGESTIELEEEYINENFSSYGTWKLEEDEYFTMGDNRQRSLDSRAWGALPKDLIVGKTFLRLFPIRDFQVKPGHIEPEEFEVVL